MITYNSILKTEGEYYYSVNLSADGHLTCGMMGGKTEIWDADRSDIRYSTRVEGHIHDMMEYGDHLYGALHHCDQLTVLRYDRQLTNRESVISIPYKKDKLSHIDVKYGKIGVTDWDNKLIKLYTTDGEFVRDIQLKDAKQPYVVCLMKDNCVLLSDWKARSVTKYRTDGSGDIEWICEDWLRSPAGLCVDEWGFVFECWYFGDTIYLLSPRGNYSIAYHQLTETLCIPALLSDLTCSELKTISIVHDINVSWSRLYLACRGHGIKCFTISY